MKTWAGTDRNKTCNLLRSEELSPNIRKGISSCQIKHINSHKEMIILESGSILVDNPGMRENIHFQSNIEEKRRKDKEFDKMYKAFKKNWKPNES